MSSPHGFRDGTVWMRCPSRDQRVCFKTQQSLRYCSHAVAVVCRPMYTSQPSKQQSAHGKAMLKIYTCTLHMALCKQKEQNRSTVSPLKCNESIKLKLIVTQLRKPPVFVFQRSGLLLSFTRRIAARRNKIYFQPSNT